MRRDGAPLHQQSALRNTASLHTVSYFGGKVIEHVKIYAVVWGAGTYAPEVTASSPPSISNFFAGITNSRYLDWLHEYDTNVTPVGGGSGTNQIIGRGTFGGLFTITPSAQHNGAVIDDENDIQPELAAQIHAGHLPAPDANTEYFLFFRHGQEITEGGMDSVHDFCAYHNTFGPPDYANEVYYGVVPDQSDGGCGIEPTAFQNLTSTVSHELIESISDAEIGLASTFASPLGWYDEAENEEIADICQPVGTGNGTVLGGDNVSYTVQLGWSDAQNACVATSGSVPAGTAPDPPTNATASGGIGHVTVSWAAPANTGGNPITDFRVTASPGGEVIDVGGTTTSATFTDLSLGATYTFTVTATNAVGTGTASDPSNPAAPASAPGAPTAVRSAAGNGVVSLAWTAPGSDGGSAIVGYTITPYVGTKALTPVLSNDTGTSATVSGLTNGATYTFRVAARNDLGTGPKSAPSGAATPLATTGMAIGDAHACAILTYRSTVACWGLNSSGQLGDGTTNAHFTPVAVTGLSNVRGLTLGGAFSCALLNAGTVRCWGRGTSGQLGNGAKTSSPTPVVVSGLSGVAAIAAGHQHVCALLAAKTVKCWGDNSSGQLGDHTSTARTTPVSVPGLTNVAAITAGGNQSCALLATRVVKCWGANTFGQLGDGSTANRNSPVTVADITAAIGVATRGSHTCAVLGNGSVRCWGLNSSGELGIGSHTNERVPVTVGRLTGARAIAAGDTETCALLANATVACWGANSYGQLGNGTTTVRTTPGLVTSMTAVARVVCGTNDVLVRRTNGGLRMWGENNTGQLGRGVISNPNPTAASVRGLS